MLDLEPEPLERVGHAARVVVRVGEARRVLVVRDPDHQRDAPLIGGAAAGPQGQHQPEQEREAKHHGVPSHEQLMGGEIIASEFRPPSQS